MSGSQDRADKMRPVNSPDYWRLVDVDQRLQDREVKGEPIDAQLRRLADFDEVMSTAIRRATATNKKLPKSMSYDALVEVGANSWVEGFAFGVLHRRMKLPLEMVHLLMMSEKFLSEDDMMSWYRANVGDIVALGFTAQLHAHRELQEASSRYASPPILPVLVATWAKGFLYGIVFEDLGGHQEPADS